MGYWNTTKNLLAFTIFGGVATCVGVQTWDAADVEVKLDTNKLGKNLYQGGKNGGKGVAETAESLLSEAYKDFKSGQGSAASSQISCDKLTDLVAGGRASWQQLDDYMASPRNCRD